MVTERERDYLYRTYASDRQMRINLGIRRRLAPLMENNRPKIELLKSLLMSMIGSPVCITATRSAWATTSSSATATACARRCSGARIATPASRAPTRSACTCRRSWTPSTATPPVNVEAQARSTASLLNWTKRLISARKAHPALSRGSLRFLRPGNRKVLAYLRQHDDQVLLCVANLARSSQPVELDLREFKGRIPLEVLGNTPFPPIGELTYLLTLPPWGFYWFELTTDGDYPKWHVERPVKLRVPGSRDPGRPHGRALAARPAATDLSAFSRGACASSSSAKCCRRSFRSSGGSAARAGSSSRRNLLEQGEWQTPFGNWLLAMVQVDLEGGSRQTYSLPLALAWEQGDGAGIDALLHCTLARVRQRARVGVLYDAFWDDAFCRATVGAMRDNATRAIAGGELRYRSTARLADVDVAELPVKHPGFEQSNTLVVMGERLVLKGYRRLRRGINPEIEIGRFLTEVSPFSNIAALLGTLEHVTADGETTAVAVAHAYVSNEGSGWDYATAHLSRLLDDTLARQATPTDATAVVATAADVADSTVLRGGFRSLMETLGTRTAQLHLALAKPSGDPAFDPEPFNDEDVAALRKKLQQEAQLTVELLASRVDTLSDAVRESAQRLLEMARRCMVTLAPSCRTRSKPRRRDTTAIFTWGRC
jgi:maltose alpha-D-glucosyltransferase/alpha-amylase